MPFLDTRHKKKSFTLTTILLSVLILLLFYIGLSYMEPPIESGISVNFGTMEFGMGEVQPTEPVRPRQQEPEVTEQPAELPPEETIPEPVEENLETEEPPEEVLTQETAESIRLRQEEDAKRKAAEDARKEREEAERIAREKREAEERARQEQEAKKQELDALMGGLNNAQGQADGSEGDDTRAGDKGNPEGNPYSTTYYGAPGSGSGTAGYGLSGRNLVSRDAVQQECNEAGRVVVKIEVDRSGKVISATPGVRGTTNNHPCLLEPARKTAFLYRWNLDNKAPHRQIGFVEVNFKLGQ
jgi:colicin import membrane protein